MVPQKCQNQAITYPAFDKLTYPALNEKRSPKGFRDFVYQSLKAGVPLETSFKASFGLHSATITGQRHVCNLNRCELQFRIQNSYGLSWQESNDQGWVNADVFAGQMIEQGTALISLMPKGKTVDKSLSAPYYDKSPVSSSADYSSREKCWKVSSTAISNVSSSGNNSLGNTPSAPSVQGERGNWICRKEGESPAFVEFSIPGWDCRKR